MKTVDDSPLLVIAGPCQLESLDHAQMIAGRMAEACAKAGAQYVFKASYDKANRTSLKGKRGLGIEAGLKVLAAVVVDVIQIPAFLCRQTDLLLAAGETGAAINVKKGQFLAPWDMKNVAAKIASTGNEKIMLCERGVSFGYNTLVADMRSLPIMAQTGYPVVMDATHSVQQPGGQGTSSGGQREFAPVLARAAVAVGVAAVFIETHPDPDKAPSDGPNMIPLREMPALIARLKASTPPAPPPSPRTRPTGSCSRPASRSHPPPRPRNTAPARPACIVRASSAGVDAAQRHLGGAVAFGPHRHQPPARQRARQPCQIGSAGPGQLGPAVIPPSGHRAAPAVRAPAPPARCAAAPPRPPAPPQRGRRIATPASGPPRSPRPRASRTRDLQDRRPRQPAMGEQHRLVEAAARS
jgi:2-dehydro-3-deoxyphosphooctonate aldolase (KDO 8-P synthase)